MATFLAVIETIAEFLKSLFTDIGLSLDTIFYAGVGFVVIMLLFFYIKSSYSYEGRMERSLDKLNRWLYYNKQIDSNNLIEFNLKIKKCPKILRYHWQQYMLYRENAPSYYMSAYNCIEKPLHTSSYVANLKNFNALNITAAIITFVLGIAQAAFGGSANILTSLLKSSIVPTIIILFNSLFLMLLRASQNFNLSSLYQNFHLFQRYIDKASATLPNYVDFEVLFTKNEIRKGIPVLNEYLEKRDIQQQEELEKARLNAVEHEKYDFAKSGINGALMLDRAMKETEVYLNIRQRTLAEIQQLESEIESYKRNYENTSKEFQRKMQASKESVERLRRQQEETTNRIESNYIKKQQNDELKKQEQLEKEQDDATLRFNQETTTLQAEIDKRRADLEGRKDYVQGAMLAEYQTFSSKLYEQIMNSIENRFNQEKIELNEQKDEIINELDEAHIEIASKSKEIEELKAIIEKAGIDAGAHGAFYSEKLRKETDKVRRGKQNKKEEVEEQLKVVEQPVQEETVQEEQPEGHYDDRGYYIYSENVYYDDKGNYFDGSGGYYDPEGNYFDANGGYYDVEGNYHAKEENTVQEEEPAVEQKVEEQVVENTPAEEEIEVPVDDEIAKNFGEELQTEEQTVAPNEEIKEEPTIIEEPKVEEKEEPKVEEESKEPEVIEKPAGKRGRPKKVVEEVEEEPKVVGKRGRPRKENVEEEIKKPAGKRGRPKKEDNVDEEPKKPAGKRGRPKKEDNENEVKKPAGKRGRPKKEEVEEVKKSTGTRGRPKKEITDKSPAPSGKRGRPKKEENESEVKKPAGKRGRPKKEEVEEKKPAGKRGRPKKDTGDDDTAMELEAPKNQANEINEINAKILEEEMKLHDSQKELDETLNEALKSFDNGSENPDDNN